VVLEKVPTEQVTQDDIPVPEEEEPGSQGTHTSAENADVCIE
jgi:hypothetical protein